MPIYEYECDACKEKVELLQKVGEDSSGEKCPHCEDGKIFKVISMFGLAGESSRPDRCAPSSST